MKEPTPAVAGLNVGFVTPVPDQVPPKGLGASSVFKFTEAELTQIEYVGLTVGTTGGLTVTTIESICEHPVAGTVYE